MNYRAINWFANASKIDIGSTKLRSSSTEQTKLKSNYSKNAWYNIRCTSSLIGLVIIIYSIFCEKYGNLFFLQKFSLWMLQWQKYLANRKECREFPCTHRYQIPYKMKCIYLFHALIFSKKIINKENGYCEDRNIFVPC